MQSSSNEKLQNIIVKLHRVVALSRKFGLHMQWPCPQGTFIGVQINAWQCFNYWVRWIFPKKIKQSSYVLEKSMAHCVCFESHCWARENKWIYLKRRYNAVAQTRYIGFRVFFLRGIERAKGRKVNIFDCSVFGLLFVIWIRDLDITPFDFQSTWVKRIDTASKTGMNF